MSQIVWRSIMSLGLFPRRPSHAVKSFIFTSCSTAVSVTRTFTGQRAHTYGNSRHVSRKMIEHYSHIRLEAKRTALDAISAQPLQAVIEASVNQNVNQVPKGDPRASAKSLN